MIVWQQMLANFGTTLEQPTYYGAFCTNFEQVMPRLRLLACALSCVTQPPWRKSLTRYSSAAHRATL